MAANVVEHFTADDKITATGKRILGQVKVHEVDMCEPSAAVSRPVECDLGDIRSDETIDAWSKLYREVAFGTGEFKSACDPAGWKQRQRLLVFRLLV